MNGPCDFCKQERELNIAGHVALCDECLDSPRALGWAGGLEAMLENMKRGIKPHKSPPTMQSGGEGLLVGTGSLEADREDVGADDTASDSTADDDMEDVESEEDVEEEDPEAFLCMACGAEIGQECAHLHCPFCRATLLQLEGGATCPHYVAQVELGGDAYVRWAWVFDDPVLPSLPDDVTTEPTSEQVKVAFGPIADFVENCDPWDLGSLSQVFFSGEVEERAGMILVACENAEGGRRYDYFSKDRAKTLAELLQPFEEGMRRLEGLLRTG